MRVSDPQVMRALAHPARIEIIDHLNHTGDAVSATQFAEMVGLSPSATSYHLRELAKYGLVEHAPSRGDGRERLWRSVGAGLRIEGDPAQPDAREAERALIDIYLTRDYNRAREWVSRAGELSPAWRDLSMMMSRQTLLTAEELVEVNQQIIAILDRYRLRERERTAPDEARLVLIHYAAFPDDETSSDETAGDETDEGRGQNINSND
jgi:DNA-binding transcriptional ArsR family regulator